MLLVFVELSINLSNFITAFQNDQNIVTVEEAIKVKAYIDKIRAIKDVLKRDHMKVAFFGRWVTILNDLIIFVVIYFINVIFCSY